jgi:5-methylcytosine-specific restriction protein A
MQNISAVLAELEEPWISGYKPAKNVGENTKKRILSLLESAGAFTAPAETPTSDITNLQQRTRRILKKGINARPSGNKRPNKVASSTEQFVRDPAVRAFVLARAEGHCELCEAAAPFLGTDGYPFLEVHHIVPLAADGADTVENAVALCPNCHRRCHHGQDKDSCADRLKSRT